MWIAVAAVVVLAVPVGITAYSALGGPSATETNAAVVDGIGAAPTAEQVAAMDRTEAFYAYFMRAAQESAVVATTAITMTVDGDTTEKGTTIWGKSGFDYGSKEFRYATEEQLPGGRIETRMRCYDGIWYHPTGRNGQQWDQRDAASLPLRCTKERDSAKVNDGVNTGGLTAEQAQTFVGTLRDQPGLVTVQGLTLVEHRGRPYLQFSVVITPVAGPSGAIRFGNGWFMMAFRETDLDPAAHVYGTRGDETGGARFEYYVDPATKLPAYSEFTPLGEDDEGATVEGLTHRTHYQFGTAEFDVEITNPAPLTMDW